MPTYRLISFKTCPWVQRAAIVLREKGVEFELVHIEPGNRPDWFSALSPLGKVPVLEIDSEVALFESGAIAEYFDETVGAPLHPEDPILRAINRAWTDYLPTFSAALGAVASAPTDDALEIASHALRKVFVQLERALVRGGDGPYFNGHRYSLVDAGYAPFLQRYLIAEELADLRLDREFPRVRQWVHALVARPSTHTFAPDVFRALYLDVLARRGGIIASRSKSA